MISPAITALVLAIAKNDKQKNDTLYKNYKTFSFLPGIIFPAMAKNEEKKIDLTSTRWKCRK